MFVYACIFLSDVEVSREVDNSNNDYTLVIDPDHLTGPQMIDMILNKPGIWDCLTMYIICY